MTELEIYIQSLMPVISTELSSIEIKARSQGLPIIRPMTVRFLHTMLAIKNPTNILEVGCLIGYSASLMALSLPANGKLLTIDRYSKLIPQARENFVSMKLSDKITLLEGDAVDILPTLEGSFDFIFIDAAKGQYQVFLKEALRLSQPGTIIVFDDVFQGGDIAKDISQIERRQRTIYRRMRAFLADFLNRKDIQSTIVPIGDGLAVGVVL